MSREARIWTYRICAGLGAAAILGATALMFPGRAPITDPTRLAGFVAMVCIGMGWVLVFAILSARQEDEYVQAGAKFAWYWGGLVGLAASAPILVALAATGLKPLAALAPWFVKEPGMALTLGYGLAISTQLFGYLIARGLWGLRRS